MFHPRTYKGFSLLEISIAIAIIALLLAAVTTVGNIKDKAHYNTMVDDINSIATAVNSFQSTYSGLPGDIYNATNFFGTIVDNGNGNGYIGAVGTGTFDNESYDFWEHLSRAGLIEGSYPGSDNVSNIPGEGVMAAPFKNGGYYAKSLVGVSGFSATWPLAIAVGKYHTGTLTNTGELNGLLTPSMAQAYDQTYDDGNPDTGKVIGRNGANSSETGNCIDSGSYVTTNESTACRLLIAIIGEGI